MIKVHVIDTNGSEFYAELKGNTPYDIVTVIVDDKIFVPDSDDNNNDKQ